MNPAPRNQSLPPAPAGPHGHADASALEAEWVVALRSGAPSAVTRLERFLRERLAVALRDSGRGGGLSGADLDELSRASASAVLARLGSYEGGARFGTWATTVAVRVAFVALRKRTGPGVFDAMAPVDAAADARTRDDAPSDSEARGRKLMSTLEASMTEALSDRQQEVLKLDLAGVPRAEIAERLGSTSEAVGDSVNNAGRQLRAALFAAGFTAPDLVEGLVTREKTA